MDEPRGPGRPRKILDDPERHRQGLVVRDATLEERKKYGIPDPVEWFDENSVLMTKPTIRINQVGLLIGTAATQLVGDFDYVRLGWMAQKRRLILVFNNESGIAIRQKNSSNRVLQNSRLRKWFEQRGIVMQVAELVPDDQPNQYYATVKMSSTSQ